MPLADVACETLVNKILLKLIIQNLVGKRNLLIATLAAIFFLFALQQDNHNADENRNNVDVKLQRVADYILIALLLLLQNDLRVEDHIAEENCKRAVKNNVEGHLKAEEHVEQRQQRHVHERAAEHGSEVQVGTLLGENGNTREAHEDRKRCTEGGRQDVRVNADNLEHKMPNAHALKERKREKLSKTALVDLVGLFGKNAHGAEHAYNARNDRGNAEHFCVDVRTQGSHDNPHCEVRINLSEMRLLAIADWGHL